MPDKPRQIGEKQASSEIAQSRARFEKWLGEETCEVHFDESANKNAWYGWRAAERDTRELVAQIAEQWEVNQFLPAGSLNQLVERIRGKE